MANQQGIFQARPRMRVPDHLVQFMHQVHVIKAICRHPEIDKEDLYGQALAGLKHGNNAKAFSALREVVYKVTSGTLLDDKRDAQGQPLFEIGLGNFDEDTSSKVCEFNHKYLNDKGDFALLTLLTFDAGDLDLAAIDIFRGGEALSAAYGPRRTRRDKRLSKEIQSLVRDLKSSDEPATMKAAYYYVEYRHLHGANFLYYKTRKQLKGDTDIYSYYREWFQKFDKAFEFPRPDPGPRGTK